MLLLRTMPQDQKKPHQHGFSTGKMRCAWSQQPENIWRTTNWLIYTYNKPVITVYQAFISLKQHPSARTSSKTTLANQLPTSQGDTQLPTAPLSISFLWYLRFAAASLKTQLPAPGYTASRSSRYVALGSLCNPWRGTHLPWIYQSAWPKSTDFSPILCGKHNVHQPLMCQAPSTASGKGWDQQLQLPKYPLQKLVAREWLHPHCRQLWRLQLTQG